MIRKSFLWALGASSLGCGSTVAEVTATADSSSAPPGLTSGEHQLYVEKVTDECLDGALALLFKPNGDAGAYALQNKTSLPALDALPAAGLIQLEAPFTDMPVEWQAGPSGGLVIRAGSVPNVFLGIAGSPDCTADLVIDADVAGSGSGVTIDAKVALKELRSATQTCPVAPPGCIVRLQMTGAPTASR